MSTDLDTRLRDDPTCPPELRETLADWPDEWPNPLQLSALHSSIHSHLALEAPLPRLRSPASGTSLQLRRALEDDFEELPTALEIANLHRQLATSLRTSSAPPPASIARWRKRSWRRALLVAALIALPAAAAAFVGYRILASRRAAPVTSAQPTVLGSPPPRQAAPKSITPAPSPTPSEVPSQLSPPTPAKAPKAPKAPGKAPAKAPAQDRGVDFGF